MPYFLLCSDHSGVNSVKSELKSVFGREYLNKFSFGTLVYCELRVLASVRIYFYVVLPQKKPVHRSTFVCFPDRRGILGECHASKRNVSVK